MITLHIHIFQRYKPTEYAGGNRSDLVETQVTMMKERQQPKSTLMLRLTQREQYQSLQCYMNSYQHFLLLWNFGIVFVSVWFPFMIFVFDFNTNISRPCHPNDGVTFFRRSALSVVEHF